MDKLEALKLLLEVEAGENITNVAIWYFAADFLAGLMVMAGLLFGLWMVLRAVRYCFQQSTDVWLERMANRLGTKSGGPFIDYEKAATKRALEELVELSQGKKNGSA